MSHRQVIRHHERILNGCGDAVRFTPTGRKLSSSALWQMAVEVTKVDLLRTNGCFPLPPPVPACAHNRPGRYAVNIIRISPSLANAYAEGNRSSDKAMETLLRMIEELFPVVSRQK